MHLANTELGFILGAHEEHFWSLFKRGVIGSYHKVSVKHLRRYLDEFTFRFNNREAEDVFTLVLLNLVIATGIKYAELTSNRDGAGTDPLWLTSL